MLRPPPTSTLFPYTTLFRSAEAIAKTIRTSSGGLPAVQARGFAVDGLAQVSDRKSTRLNSSHEWISYAVFCLKKKNEKDRNRKRAGSTVPIRDRSADDDSGV